MKPAIKRKWVEALCSGKYEQGKGMLRDENAYCCLGVLGEVCAVPDAEMVWALLSEDYAKKQLGLTFRHQCELAGLNDSGVPFEVIAGFIQENL